MPISIAVEDPAEPDLVAILRAHLAQMRAQSPPESVHALDLDGLRDPAVTFLALREDGRALAVGALKRLGTREGEIKSMHCLAEARGRGLGVAMLERLLGLARERGMVRLFLETGATDDFLPARSLYARHGFVACGPFADYPAHPFSAFMTLELPD